MGTGFPSFSPPMETKTPLTFTYIDDTTTSIQSFYTHFNHYLPLLRALNNFHFVFVSTNQLKFDSADRYFHARVNANPVCEQGSFANDLIRYFTLRQQWEDPKQRRALTQEQILFLSAAKHAYSNSIHEQQYNEWKITKRLSLPELQGSPHLASFSTFLVEEKFQLLSG